MSRTNVSQKIKDKNKKKEKPVNADPRPKIKDFPNREAYHQAVLKWNKRRKDRIAKEKTEELKQKGLVKTSRGLKKRKTKTDLKVKKKPFAKDRVGKPDLTSPSYKEAKAANEKPVEYQTNKKPTGETTTTETPKTETPKTETTKTETPKNEVKKSEVKKDKLKIKKGSAKNFIKTKKGFARRGTPMAKRAEERERRRKKLAAKGYMKNR